MNANDTPLDHDGFDRKARQLHADALAQLSAATTAQLQQRRRLALQGRATHSSPGIVRPLVWTGALALLAVAIVLPVAMRQPAAPDVPAVAATTTAADDTVATLEEDPDLYLWLASSDAIALASE